MSQGFDPDPRLVHADPFQQNGSSGGRTVLRMGLGSALAIQQLPRDDRPTESGESTCWRAVSDPIPTVQLPFDLR